MVNNGVEMLQDFTTLSHQHDHNFGGTLREAFFVEKLGDDLTVTGRSMRVKEEPSLGKDTFSTVTTDINFNHLCRGIKLVMQAYANTGCPICS